MRRGLAIVALSAAVFGAWWYAQPRTPAELYRARCAACHALPDMSRYQGNEMAEIVRMMRESNGGEDVIGGKEAALIARYLEEKWTP